MSKITLYGGPYDGKEIEDSGVVRIRMGITEDGTERHGVLSGTAVYEPSEDRSCAFWLHNTWDGILEEVIPI